MSRMHFSRLPSRYSRAPLASLLCTALSMLTTGPASANLLTNGDFEVFNPAAGYWAGWNMASYLGGQFGPLTTDLLFDTTGLGASAAAGFQVGGNATPGGVQFSQVFNVASAGDYTMSLDVASQKPGACCNADGGTFVLAIDDLDVDMFAAGYMATTDPERDHLSGVVTLSAGAHSF